MAVSVYLDFIPPNQIPNLAKLHIFESADQNGTFDEIEVVTPVGSTGNYITSYTTDKATSASNWFTIQWEDDKGALTDMSDPVQGGTRTLVYEIVQRVLLREPNLSEEIVVQEAEAAISDYYGVIDPYSIDPSTVSPKILSGLTNLTLARTYISRTISATATEGTKWVAGLVSLDTTSGSSKSADPVDRVKALLALANHDLGRNYTVIMLLEEIEVAGGYQQVVAQDLSRSIIEVQ